jgi:type II secretory pathway pseudopilin PulG
MIVVAAIAAFIAGAALMYAVTDWRADRREHQQQVARAQAARQARIEDTRARATRRGIPFTVIEP